MFAFQDFINERQREKGLDTSTRGTTIWLPKLQTLNVTHSLGLKGSSAQQVIPPAIAL